MRPFGSQLGIVGFALGFVQQADPCRGDFVQQLLYDFRVFARLERAQEHHTGIGRVRDHLDIRFEHRDAQQRVVIRRSEFRWDA